MGEDTVFANGRSVATKGTDHVAVNAEEWDELNVPPAMKVEPTINVAYMSTLQNGTVRCCIVGKSVWHTGGYLATSEEYPIKPPGTKGRTSWKPYRGDAWCIAGSPNVYFEGMAAVRHYDSTTQDNANSRGVVLLRSDLARIKAALDEERSRRASGASKPPAYKGRAAPRLGPRSEKARLEASQNDYEKAQRLEQRRALIRAGRAKAAEYPEGSQEHRILADAATRLERNNEIVPMAELSSDVYDDSGAPAGWERIETHDKITGFYAAVYRSTIDPPQTVLVFRGTEMLSIRDWLTNKSQSGGKPSFQYAQAAALAQEVVARYPDAVITGHSLGGGLASLGSAVTGNRAITWNAAGLHPDTAAAYDVDIRKPEVINKIEAFHLYGEILTTAQESSAVEFLIGELPDALGRRLTIMPSTQKGKEAWKATRHKIGVVIEEIEGQKEKDKATLAAWAGLNDPWQKPLLKNPE
jgi:hypothetical protein